MIEYLSIKRALISVHDKSGLIDLVKVLKQFNIEIYASDGTYNFLSKEFNSIKSLSEISGISSILDGRVKTLHPHIHSAILARKDSQKHLEELNSIGVEPFDLVIVNFYPFEKVVSKVDSSLEEVIENIDIGGPTLVRSAAKNFHSVAVVSSTDQYSLIIEELTKNKGKIDFQTRRRLASDAFKRIAEYDLLISKYFNKDYILNFSLPLEKDLRYGENPHQSAKLYGCFLKNFQQLHGKELSYNNILDIVSATQLVFEFDEIACAIIKHNSPCGVAIGNSIKEVYEKALKSDQVSAFGGIVAFNRSPDIETAHKLNEIFLEVIVAPDFDENVLDILKKKKERRLIKVNKEITSNKNFLFEFELRSVPGGILLQSVDRGY